MRKFRLLDAFCGAGGATKGYQWAGFHVTGVDIEDQPEYCGDDFIKGDAVNFIRKHGHEFDAIHASPPCHDHSVLSSVTGKDGSGDLLMKTRRALIKTEVPWVIENVMQADMPGAIVLCGTEFDLTVNGFWLSRHRKFESNIQLRPKNLWNRCCCRDGRRIAGVYGHSDGPAKRPGRNGWSVPSAFARQLLGTPWINNRYALSQSIPPVYTEFIGRQLMSAIRKVDRQESWCSSSA